MTADLAEKSPCIRVLKGRHGESEPRSVGALKRALTRVADNPSCNSNKRIPVVGVTEHSGLNLHAVLADILELIQHMANEQDA